MSVIKTIPKFIIGVFVFLFFLAISPMLYEIIQFTTDNLACSTNYGIICFMVDAALPIMGLVLLTLIIGYLQRQ